MAARRVERHHRRPVRRTDPDGSAIGRTPELIRHVTKLLALREIPALTDSAQREDRQKRWRLVSERTRDQGYNLEPLRAQGVFTGDDAILVAYQRPPQLGAACVRGRLINPFCSSGHRGDVHVRRAGARRA